MTYEQGVLDSIEFVLSHYEVGKFVETGTIIPIDPEEWWAKIQLLPIDRDKLLANSKEHYLARINMWKTLALKELVHE